MRNLLMSQISKLHKMPDLAEMIENYQPQPDPYIEKMKELEMRKLIAEIIERRSRADENEVDRYMKMTQAEVNKAKARQLGGEADMTDLDFTRKADGTEFNEKMQEKGFDHKAAVVQSIVKEKAKPAPARSTS